MIKAWVGIFLWLFASGAQAGNPGANLAAVARPSSAYTSGDTTVEALNDGFTPKRSRDDSHGSYGNWPRRGTLWVQYEWAQPISESASRGNRGSRGGNSQVWIRAE